jgi:hypothetical protein
MRWASTRSRHDGRPTDTQVDTQSRSPHQGATDHCLMSRRRHCAEEMTIATVLLRELHVDTKTKVGSTAAKAPAPRTHPNIDETPTAPKSHTHLSHECVGRARDPEAMSAPPTLKPTRKAEVLVREPPTIVSHRVDVGGVQFVCVYLQQNKKKGAKAKGKKNCHTKTKNTYSPITLANISTINVVFIFRCSSSTSNPVYVRNVDSSALVFSLSSYRHSYIGLVSSSRFID